MDFLQDLDKDIVVHRIGLYSVVRYSFKPFSGWIDKEGNTITERVFGFMLYRGKKWFNNTHLNIKESELDTVVSRYEEFVTKMTQERKEKLTIERSARKSFPIKHEFIFENVTIVAIEMPCYYSQGFPRTYGSYFEPKEKIVQLYANGFPYRGDIHLKIDDKIDIELILEKTIDNHINKNYSQNEFKDSYVSTTSTKFDFAYIPIIYIIGYVFEIDGENVEFYNYSSGWRGGCFETSKGIEVEVSLLKIMSEGKIVGELQGMEAWTSLLNKVKFV